MNLNPNPTRPAEPADWSFKPRLNQLLHSLRIDVAFERGAGNHLYYRDAEGRDVAVLDLVGGYGSLLFGHAHPALVAEAVKALQTGRPTHAQGSRREHAARLARDLSRRAGGDYCVLFGNSGAEAVEAAMKHAMLETGGRTFIALERAFHGKTLGAVQLTANPRFREEYGLSGLKVVRLAANDLEALEAAFASVTDLAGFIFEPILGEGGVRAVEPEFARRAAELCVARDVPLIADECQTGMGRTGVFLACETLGIRPDYVLLSKSLGGGLAKISATLIRRERYQTEFDLQHTSTYAEDDYSCDIALKALELLDAAMLETCRERGEKLLAGLRQLAGKYPTVIADVRGRGLMIGVEFRRRERSSSFLLRFLTTQEDLVYVIMGYLLNVHQVRVAPTLSDKFTLRLEPSALIEDAHIAQFLRALEEACVLLRQEDALRLTAFLNLGPVAPGATTRLVRNDAQFTAFNEPRLRERQARPAGVKVGWLCHLVDSDDFLSLEPAFARMNAPERERFLEHNVPRLAPVVMSAVEVRSLAGDAVRFFPILLPVTSRWMKRQLEARELGLPQALVQQGVDLARSLDCQLVSLGQYTSIVTLNGTQVAPRGMGVTSGNSYAIALAVQAIERAQAETGLRPEESVLVIVGAGGNIGRTCAELLAPRYRRTVLVGSARPGARLRLQEFVKHLPNTTAATDPAALRAGDVVLVAINAVDAPLREECFKPGALVCDLSVPSALPGSAAASRDLFVIKGGIAALPYGEDLEFVGFPLPRGQAYGCMAEAMLLGYAGVRDGTFAGNLSREHVLEVTRLAEAHGFSLADYKRACVFGSQTKEAAYAGIH
jgi:acetylornithine/succinyldiaminopimelate/putrescine aminotransferase/predicted amino acid dehydrogenase